MIRTYKPIAALALLLGACVASSVAQEPAGEKGAATPSSPAASDADLARQQQAMAKRFDELQRKLLTMSEATAATDPKRAALLRQAYSQSTQRALEQRIAEIVKLLQQEQLTQATKDQADVQAELGRLLELLLSGDRSKQIASEKARVEKILKQVNQLIKEQKVIQGQTAGDGEAEGLAKSQGGLAEKTGKLAGEIKEHEGDSATPKPESPSKNEDGTDPKTPPKTEGEQKPADGKAPGDSQSKPDGEQGEPPSGNQPQAKPAGESPGGGNQKQTPPSDGGDSQSSPPQPSDAQAENQPAPARQRIEAAQQKMREAQQKLEDAKKRDAVDDQERAIEELERAKAELEEILRQLREEEIERVLAMLEARFRKMLEMQTEVLEGTKRLHGVPEADRERDDEIEAGRLSDREKEIVVDADKALNVMKEEGSAVAFPEAVLQMRDDMLQVTDWLAKADVGELTQTVEQDIITALEEMIAALQQAQKDQREQRPQQPGEGEMVEPPLVDRVAEIKMIRTLQMRVNLRHRKYSDLVKGEQAENPELLEALSQLAEREMRIHRAVRDIVTGRNQ